MWFHEHRKIICKIVIFVSTTLIIYTMLFFFVCGLKVRPGTSYFYNDFADYLNHSGDADIIILGNSRALSSLSSSVIHSKLNKKTYNLAYRSANLHFTVDMLRDYLKKSSRNPSICLLEVSWCSFSKLRLTYPQDNPQLSMKFCNLKESFLLMRGIRFKLFESAVEGANMDKQFKYVDWWDGDPRKGPAEFDPSNFKLENMQKSFPDLEAGVDSGFYQNFKEIIDICKTNDIKLILYSAPEAPIYTSHQKDRQKVKNLIIDTAIKNELPYLDFTHGGKYYIKELDHMIYDSEHVRRSDEFTILFLSNLRKEKII